MKKKTNDKVDNYLERVPVREESVDWDVDRDNLVVLHIENKGVIKKLTQLILMKPRVSHIHLDEIGSSIWVLMDGERNIVDMGAIIRDKFGEKAEPLYERMAEYISILASYGFVGWKTQ